jgi:SAM-dependent methyltransferase
MWAGERVERWVRRAAALESQLSPVADLLFAAAALAAGERVLDVGCGTGPTTRRAASLVGSSGAVTGLDISTEMLELAATTETTAGAAAIEWLCADAVDWSAPSPLFDAVVSRFGVMFFSDPVKAFANLAAATTPGGRLAMTTWARRDDSAMFAVPLHAALAAIGLDDSGLSDVADAFSLHDAETIGAVLAPAGWTDIKIARHVVPLLIEGGVSPDDAAVASLDVGPTRRVTTGIDEATRRRVVDAIATALRDHVGPDGNVVLDGTVVVTTARRRRIS